MEESYNLSEANRGRIVGLWEGGFDVNDISLRIPCNRNTVMKWINRWFEGGVEALSDYHRQNRRQRLTTVEEDDDLISQVDENPFNPVSDAINALHLPISRWSGYRRLHEAQIHCFRAARKIAFSQRHREDRVAFALQELMTTPEDWEVTIWTDEKVFCSAVDRRLRVWRPGNCRLDPQYVVPHERSGRITCAMWGWISGHCPGELVQVSSHMTAEEYIDILENVMLPSVRSIYTTADVPTFRFVQDNSAVHTARIVKQWFEQHPEIIVLNWPPKSPDLNLIENVWAEIVNKWDTGHERTQEALIAHAKNA